MTLLDSKNRIFSLHSLALSVMLALLSNSVLADEPYSSLDSDQDGQISQPQYNSYREDDTRRYEGWDQNQDNRLDENEWIDPYPGDRGEYNSWDRIEDNYHDNQ